MAIRINDADDPQPPFNPGTVLVFEDGGDGRIIRLRDAQEAQALADAARYVAENWHVAEE